MSPLYAGETTRIRSTGADFNGEPLTDYEVDAFITVYRTGTDTIEVEETPMPWNDDEEAFVYDWNTTNIEAGSFLAKVRFQGIGFETWEYKRFRLRRNPV